jgi:hypothetical protein
MKLNVDMQLVAFNGEPMTENTAEDSPPATLKSVLVQACLMAQESSGDEKYRVYRLLKRIDAGSEVELSAEDVSKLKALVGNYYPVAVIGPVFDILEGQPLREAS